MDPDAYYCPKCRNYYCFHCRARLLASDKQYQCGNKACDYYGKLLCGVCDSEVRKEEPTAVYLEPEDGYWPLLMIASFILAVLTWLASSFSVGLFFGIAAFAGGAYALHRAGINVFGRKMKSRNRGVRPTTHAFVAISPRVKFVTRVEGAGERNYRIARTYRKPPKPIAAENAALFYWIYDIPTESLAILFDVAFVGFFWAGCILFAPSLACSCDARTGSNEVVGHILSCFCVFYGLLLGLLAVAAYQNYSGRTERG